MENQTLTAAQVVALLEENGVAPDHDFCAASKGYGSVRAWNLYHTDALLLAVDFGADTEYLIREEDPDDLAALLIPDDLGGIERALCMASVHGEPKAAKTGDEECAVLAGRDYYGPDTQWEDEGFRGTYAECAAHIAELDEARYDLAHNESGRPNYVIVAL